MKPLCCQLRCWVYFGFFLWAVLNSSILYAQCPEGQIEVTIEYMTYCNLVMGNGIDIIDSNNQQVFCESNIEGSLSNSYVAIFCLDAGEEYTIYGYSEDFWCEVEFAVSTTEDGSNNCGAISNTELFYDFPSVNNTGSIVCDSGEFGFGELITSFTLPDDQCGNEPPVCIVDSITLVNDNMNDVIVDFLDFVDDDVEVFFDIAINQFTDEVYQQVQSFACGEIYEVLLSVGDADGNSTVCDLVIIVNCSGDDCGNTVLDFDGVNDNIFFPGIGTVTDFSIGCWFRQDVDNGGAEDRIISFGSNPRLELGIDQVGNLWLFDQNFGNTISYDFVRDGEWHHIAYVAEGTSRSVYLDFEIVDNYSSGSTAYGPNLRIGAWAPGPTGGTLFVGKIEDVRGFDVVVSDGDIFQKFGEPAMVGDPNLMIYLDFEEGIPNSDNTGISEVVNQGILDNGLIENFNLIGNISNYVCDSIFTCMPIIEGCADSISFIYEEECSAIIDFDLAFGIDPCNNDQEIIPECYRSDDLSLTAPYPLGITAVTCVYTSSVSGLDTTCVTTVEVIDEVLPICVLQNTEIRIGLDQNGVAFISPEMLDGGSFDECSVVELSIEVDQFTCSDIGVNEVTLFVSDESGNVNGCNAIVVIEDKVAPSCNLTNFDIGIGADGNIELNPDNFLQFASDNCEVTSVDFSNTTYTCQDLGANDLVATFFDGSGNSCVSNITMNILDPFGFCDCILNPQPPNIEGCTEFISTPYEEECSAFVDFYPAFGADPCNNNEEIIPECFRSDGLTLFDFYPLGITSVVCVYTTDSGLSDSCVTSVEILDYVPPNCNTTTFDIYLNDDGRAIVPSSIVLDVATDDCSIVSNVFNTSVGYLCTDIASDNIMQIPIQDQNGNSLFCDYFVNIIDTIPPTCFLQDTTISFPLSGELVLDAVGFMEFASDNCEVTSVSFSNTTYSCQDLGANDLAATFFDSSGNSCTSNVTLNIVDPFGFCDCILDPEPPSIEGCDEFIQVPYEEECSAFVDFYPPFGIDPCNSDQEIIPECFRSDDLSLLAPYPLGITTVTCVFTSSVTGLTSECNTIVEVVDNVPPECVPFLADFFLDQNGVDTLALSSITPQGFDDCGFPISFVSPSQQLSVDCLSESEIAVDIQDVFGNVSTCQLTLNINDTIPPIVNCEFLEIDVTLDIDGIAPVSLDLWDIDAADNCTEVTIPDVDFIANCNHLGQLLHWPIEISDQFGNSTVCNLSAMILDPTGACECFNDTTPPSCGTDVIDIPIGSNGRGEFRFDQLGEYVLDDCSEVSFNGEANPIDVFCDSDITIETLIFDQSNNSQVCQIFLNPVDNIPPICSEEIVTIDLTLEESVELDFNSLDHSDNCNDWSTEAFVSVDCFTNPNNAVVEYTIADGSGNSSHCGTFLNIQFNSSIEFTFEQAECYKVFLIPFFNSHFREEVDFEWTLDGIVVSNEQTPMLQFDNLNAEVCVTINSGFCEAMQCTNVNLETIERPEFEDCNDIVVVADSECGAFVSDLSAFPFSICGSIEEVAITRSDGLALDDQFPIGVTNIVVVATDNFGVTNQCDYDLIVEDVSSPICTAGLIATVAPLGEDEAIVTFDIDIEDCSELSQVTFSQNSGTFFPCGVTEVTAVYTDVFENVGSCTFDVIVQCDCVSSFTYEQEDGCYSISAQAAYGGYAETPSVLWSLNDEIVGEGDDVTFLISTSGVNQLCLFVLSEDCESVHCEELEIAPGQSPIIEGCEDIVLNANQNCLNNQNINPVIGQSICEEIDVTIEYQRSDNLNINQPWPLGVTNVQVIARDDFGATSNCTFTVTVEDVTPPECQDVQIDLLIGDSGSINIVPTQIVEEFSDNCGISSIISSISTLTCNDIGENIVTFTYSDGTNSQQCQATINLIDAVDPTCTINDITVLLDTNGEASITLDDLGYIANDNCGIASSILSRSEFTCADIGVQEVSVIVTDHNGRSAVCTSIITVVDEIPPDCLPITQEIILTLENIGESLDFVSILSSSGSDNCSVNNIVSTEIPQLSCEVVGENVLSYTVTDDGGLFSVCEITLTVIDGIPPTCEINDIDILATSDEGAVVNFGGVATDLCGDVEISYSMPDGDLYPCGEYQITMTAVDIHGNEASCDFEVMVRDCDACCLSEEMFFDITNLGFDTEAMFNNGANCIVQMFPPPITECQFITQLNWGDGTITNGQFPSYLEFTHEYTDIGTYSICVTIEEADSGDCFSNQLCDSIEITQDCGLVTSTSNSLNEIDLIVFPNPTKDWLFISANLEFDLIQLYDSNGRLLKVQITDKVDLADYQSGIYLLRFKKGGESIVKKIIKID